MNLTQDITGQSAESLLFDAENRLKKSRAALRWRLEHGESGKTSAPFGDINVMAHMATWVARDWVRQHPYASLSAATLTGAALARWKPWRGFGGSLLAGVLARQALTLSMSSSGRVFNWLLDTLSKKTNPPARPNASFAARDSWRR